MSFPAVKFPVRMGGAVALLALVAACTEPFDYDLRGRLGAFSTAGAAQAITGERPKPDARGIISYPNYQVAVTRRDDTVTDVANRIGLPAGELARYNGIDPDVKLREGEVLALPRRVTEPVPGSGGVDIETLAGSAIDSAPDTTPVLVTELQPTVTPEKPAPAPASSPEPVRHKVVRGETAYTVSRLYQVPVKSLAEWNGLGSDFAIREGQYLLIPVTGGTPPKRSATVAPATAAAVTDPGVGSPTPTPPSAVTPLPDEKITPTPPEAPKTSVGTPSNVTSNAAMAYPVKGKIIRAYSKGRNEGIDISAADGTAVTAAADGTVAAITADAKQIPIVVVRHPDNLLTVYANVENITITKGETVKRGQKLANLRSGSDSYVHFEVRNGFDSVDPTPYLE